MKSSEVHSCMECNLYVPMHILYVPSLRPNVILMCPQPYHCISCVSTLRPLLPSSTTNTCPQCGFAMAITP